MTATDPRPARLSTAPKSISPAGPDSLSGHGRNVTPRTTAAEGSSSPQAEHSPVPSYGAPAGTNASHGQSPAGDQAFLAVADHSLSGHRSGVTRPSSAAEGQISPQATARTEPEDVPPAGITPGHGHRTAGIQRSCAVAEDFPGGQRSGSAQSIPAAGDSDAGRLATNPRPAPNVRGTLADPLLALAADVLDDLEKVRIANENRLRQLTRSAEDADGEIRGFGLDEGHPDVARLAALVKMLGDAEHQAELNLGRLMRRHPLGLWVKTTAGIGEKQGARLIAAIGDPYVRPEIVRKDGTVEPSRPRLVSELWAYAGYHVISTPVSGHSTSGAQLASAADGSGFPAGQATPDTQRAPVGGDQAGHPGHRCTENHGRSTGVAPKRARGQRANWSATAKMRAYLVAVSCMKCLDSPYRAVYEDARAKYADALHEVACVRCGPKNSPAEPGSPLSDGHKHARALRAVAKAVLRDLWREARRLHELPGSPSTTDPQQPSAAGDNSHGQEAAA
jgi:hypothetical protein